MNQNRVNIDFSQPQVMAILNVTPDSFYSESRNISDDQIKHRVERAINEGATIIDVGGYSSRPGADDVDVEEEWSRVKQGITIIRSISANIVISVDTFRSEVARRVIETFGTVIINDISAGEIDPSIVDVVAQYDVPYIAMHMRGTPQSMQSMTDYSDITEDVIDYFTHRVEYLKSVGVKDIILDPGFGFAKSLEQNYSLMANMRKICDLGYPVLSGISRKSMIYKALDLTPQDALSGTIALNWESLRQGATVLRVHDVSEASQVVTLFNLYSNQVNNL